MPDPMQMLRGNGYGCDPTGWKYVGKAGVVGTHRFKLVRIEDYCHNIDEVRQHLGEENIPEGVWREAFERKYPRSDGKGPIGFADTSWVTPDGKGLCFPVLHATVPGWVKYFDHACGDHGKEWRWLVEAK